MPKKTSLKPLAKTIDDFGVPSPAKLQQASVVSRSITKMIADDKTIAAFHHKMVHQGIGRRVEFALAIAANKNAFANFVKDARIKGLPRPPEHPSETLKCLFQATYLDPKKASKYYKRIEPMWIKRCSAAEVLIFLEKHGVSKQSPKTLPPARKPGPGTTASAPATPNKTSGRGNDDRVSTLANNDDDVPGGSFMGWKGETTVDQFYDLRVKVAGHVGEATIFELVNVLPAVVQ